MQSRRSCGTRLGRSTIGLAFLVLVVASGCGDESLVAPEDDGGRSVEVVGPAYDHVTSFTFHQFENPTRTTVRDQNGDWVATFTDGARTVRVRGPERLFIENGDTVRTRNWVRLRDVPYDGVMNAADESAWLWDAIHDTSPDVFEYAMEYLAGAPDIYDGNLHIAGDAPYDFGADFNDFIGIAWNYPSGSVDNPESSELGELDCSGFVRMVFGYRPPDSGSMHRVPLSLTGTYGLPRTSYNMEEYSPGIHLLVDDGTQQTDLSDIYPGDLVFFDSAGDSDINHVGIYLDEDTEGNHRFISSLPSSDGPAMGKSSGSDYIINGSGFWASSFRAALRL